jgi:hypothetical protein
MNNKEYDIPVEVIKGLEEVRKSGKYNMYDAQAVLCELHQRNKFIAVSWLLDKDKIDRGYGSQVDNKKYGAALKELGEVLAMPSKMSKK